MKNNKLTEGDALIFSDTKTLITRETVASIDKKQGFAILSNKVKVYRQPDKDGVFQRLDGRPSRIILLTDETEVIIKAKEAKIANHKLLKELVEYNSNLDLVSSLNLCKNIVLINKKLNKLLTAIKS